MMNKLVRTSGILIPRSLENSENYTIIKKRLTRRGQVYNKSPFVINKFYVEGPSFLKIPRFFPLYEIDNFISIENKIPVGKDININHHVTLRDDLQKDMARYMLTNNNGIIQASPGSGKTVVAVYVVCERKKKTLILVHRESLIFQWIGPGTPEKPQGFLAHSDISPDRIARLSSSNFEEDLKKDIIVATDQTFLSLLKRKREPFLKALNSSGIGIFIGDEVHTTIGAPTFSECSIHIPVETTFGLSATPDRIDGNGDIIEFHLGPVYVPKGEASVMDARVTFILFNYGIIEKSHQYVYWGGMFQRARYLNLLRKSEILLNISKSLLEKFYKDGRDILYISERLNLIDLLFKWFPGPSKSKFTAGVKNEMLDYQVVFTTPGKSRDGVDVPQKDCLIISSPISNIEQLSGRVVRISKNKEEPIIVHLIDIGCEDICRSMKSMLNYYDKKKWKVKFVVAFSNATKKEITREEALDLIFIKE